MNEEELPNVALDEQCRVWQSDRLEAISDPKILKPCHYFLPLIPFPGRTFYERAETFRWGEEYYSVSTEETSGSCQRLDVVG